MPVDPATTPESRDWWCCPCRHQSRPTTHGLGAVLMPQRKITVKGRGQEARVTFYLEAYRDKVLITSFNCPFTCEAILETTQSDALVDLIIQTTKEARGHKNGPTS